MLNVNLTTKNISELCSTEYIFHMPTYQRGYRWDSLQVEKLLNDIWEFYLNKDKQSLGNYYCLQPIVIKSRDSDSINWELIDGQQRLTTIYIILKLLENSQFPEPLFSIKFDRDIDKNTPERELYLCNIRDNINNDSFSRIDFYYFNNTSNVIQNWIKSTMLKYPQYKIPSTLSTILSNDVRIIWYEIEDTSNTKDVFRHINDGKIPLTNSELIKALLLNSRHFTVSNNEDIRNKIIRMEQERIATLWDEIEIVLHNEEFWAFINENYNDKATRIEYIFDLIYSKNMNVPLDKIKGFSTFNYFEDKLKSGENVNDIWDLVKEYYRTFQDWYNDCELYNKIGYLVHYIGKKQINDLILQSTSRSKREFKSYLDDQIRKDLDLHSLDTLSYNSNRSKVEKVLVLFNIETLVQSIEERRFPFSKLKSSKDDISAKWSIEHIYAQNPENLRKEQQITWLETHIGVLNRRLNHVPKEKREKFENLLKDMQHCQNEINTISDEEFAMVFSKLQNLVDNFNEDDIHSIKNLTLLNCGQNSALSNSVFDVKRQKIIKMTEIGEFIPICTLMVFQKFYNNAARQFDYWSKEDGEAYLNSMNRILKKYLS